jgi:hypothetical protein
MSEAHAPLLFTGPPEANRASWICRSYMPAADAAKLEQYQSVFDEGFWPASVGCRGETTPIFIVVRYKVPERARRITC